MQRKYYEKRIEILHQEKISKDHYKYNKYINVSHSSKYAIEIINNAMKYKIINSSLFTLISIYIDMKKDEDKFYYNLLILAYQLRIKQLEKNLL